jgi:NAD(P)H-flavin reductase
VTAAAVPGALQVLDPRRPSPLRVERVLHETRDTFTLELLPAAPWPFEPGQFNMVYVPGYGEVPISISGDPNEPQKLIHTIRAVGPVTRALERIVAGDWLLLRGPFGTGWPRAEDSETVVVVAGGIGLAPLRPLIYAALALRRQLFILYGARSPADILFGEQLQAWSAQAGVHCVVSVDQGDATWHGNTGVVTKHIAHVGFDPAHAVASVCGPEVMMRYAARELARAGLPETRIFVSLERNMKCAVGHCGHCQLGPHLLCRTGPVVDYTHAAKLMTIREL